MPGEFLAAFQGAKSLYELIKATQGLSNSVEVLTAVSDVQQKLMDANAAALASQLKQSELTERVRELEAQLRESEDWKKEMERYQLVTLPTGVFARQLKQLFANREPTHYLCTACADKKKRLYCSL